MNPVYWGWVVIEGSLKPIRMKNQPTTQELLEMMFCNFKKRCGASYVLAKNLGLFCNATCGDNFVRTVQQYY